MNPVAKVIDNITYDTMSQMIFLLSVVGVIIGGGCVIYYFYSKKQAEKSDGGSESKSSESSENEPSESKPSEGSENKSLGGLDDSVKIPEEDMLVEDNTPWIDILDKIWDIYI